MTLKIAVIADVHYKTGDLDSCGRRRTAIADILLLRTVHRLNRFIKPDVTLVLGDLIDEGDSPRSKDELLHLKGIIDLLKSPAIVIPGNHDGDVNDFFDVFYRPDEITDIGGVRFVTFVDPEEPGYNARRTDEDIRRMRSARQGHDGPLVSVQHVPLFPSGKSASPYHYVNSESIWQVFEEAGYTLAISGHFHGGEEGRGKTAIAPALCESPFSFFEITIDGEMVKTKRHRLMMPPELGLIDYHVHTPFAYCQENMDPDMAVAMAREMGLGGFAFTEHSGQLYFDRETFWSASFMERGLETTTGRQDRMQNYLDLAHKYSKLVPLGFEIDCDYSGNPVIRLQDLEEAQIRVGSIHWLAELRKPEPDIRLACEEMIGRLTKFLPQGIQILAHPFRVFRGREKEVPDDMVVRLVDLLKQHNVAAEINFHNQETSPEFVRRCVESGVKLVFGSDSHNLYEVGQFAPHLDLIERAGYSHGDLPEILADFGLKG